MVRALLYPVGDIRPHIVYVTAPIVHDDEPDTYCWAEDFDLSQWFPSGTRLVRISAIPATTFLLHNDYTLVTNIFQPSGPHNRCLFETLGINIRGNLLVFRHSQAEPQRITHINYAEKRLIDLVVFR